MNQNVDNQLGGHEIPTVEDVRLQERAALRKVRGIAMTNALMAHWKFTPRRMAEMYAARCLAADPLTDQYYELVEKLKKLEKRSDDIAAENYIAGGICRRETTT